VNTEKARERGAELGEKAAIVSEKVRETAYDAGITTKIKAKMALDDTVRSRAIDVSTDGSTVTVSGTVGSIAEQRRAIALARETDGVSLVVDRLTIHAR
jgi:osmotically-inducible protein OsmY